MATKPNLDITEGKILRISDILINDNKSQIGLQLTTMINGVI